MDKTASPPLLPIFRSLQQAELLALLLGDADVELGITDLASTLGIPYPSAHREVERAESAGLLRSRRVGRTRLVRANVDSPYYAGLSEVLTRAFGPPAVLAAALAPLPGIAAAYIFGSWAARYHGLDGDRPVGDIDLLVLGEPDRDALYAATHEASQRLGRPVEVTIRDRDWLTAGEGSFHRTVTGRPIVSLPISGDSVGAQAGGNRS